MERDKAYDLLLQGSVSDVDENLDPTLQIRSPSGVSRWIWRSYVLGLLLTGNLLAYLSLVKERHPISIPTDDIPTHYGKRLLSITHGFLITLLSKDRTSSNNL